MNNPPPVHITLPTLLLYVIVLYVLTKHEIFMTFRMATRKYILYRFGQKLYNINVLFHLSVLDVMSGGFFSLFHLARIYKPFKEPRIWFPAWRAGTVQQPYLSYWPARLHRLAESIPWNRFLGPLNVYKFLALEISTMLLPHPPPPPIKILQPGAFFNRLLNKITKFSAVVTWVTSCQLMMS